MRNVPLEKLCDYACEDADVTMQLYGILSARIRERKLNDLAEMIEFPLVPVLCGMEKAGTRS